MKTDGLDFHHESALGQIYFSQISRRPRQKTIVWYRDKNSYPLSASTWRKKLFIGRSVGSRNAFDWKVKFFEKSSCWSAEWTHEDKDDVVNENVEDIWIYREVRAVGAKVERQKWSWQVLIQGKMAADGYIDIAGDTIKLKKISQGGFAFSYTIRPWPSALTSR
jgi:hypothetical protein